MRRQTSTDDNAEDKTSLPNEPETFPAFISALLLTDVGAAASAH